ncbi:coiled-coil domain-containing protein 81-like isoform 2-T3 [Synchiropus picturatus]
MTDVLRQVSTLDEKTFPTISRLPRKERVCIWAHVSSHIERQMTSQKGVHLAGLGTFTFSQQRLDTGLQKPIFLLSGTLIKSLGLRNDRPLAVATRLPVVQVNFSAVSQETRFSRDVVEKCVKETLLLLVRSLLRGESVSLTFPGLGVLSCRQNKVQMEFNTSLRLDGRQQRPEARTFSHQRPKTADQLILPALRSPLHDSDKLSPDSEKTTSGFPRKLSTKSSALTQQTRVEGELSPAPTPEASDRSPQIPQSSPQEGSKTKSFTRTTCAELELCGVCLQRSKRNVPVYEREQKLAEEKHQEKVLLLRAQQEARLHLEKEQAKRKERRLQAQKDAVLNLQMSEKDQTCSSLDGTSFLFLTRPLTPPRKVKQQQYMSALQHQVESRRQQEALELRESRLTEHQNQIQQAQRNLELKSRQLQEKMEKRRSYKAALDSQVKDRKCTTHVEVQPEAFRSRRCETPVVNAERREAAQQLFWTNSSAATQRKREEVQRHRAELEREKQMLQQNQKEFVLDHRINVERRKAIRKSLESEWRQSAQMKHQREEKEMDFLRHRPEGTQTC